MAVEKITKRDGRVVDFDQNKIETAMQKAFVAKQIPVQDAQVHDIATHVVMDLEAKFGETVPSVEDVQDLVERQIAAAGYFEVAKAYILYRFQQKEKREEQKAEAVSQAKAHKLTVTLRDGQKVPFDVNEITDLLMKCCGEHRGEIDVDGVVADAIGNVYDGITTHELNVALTMALKARIERDPVYSTVAARVLLNDLYRDVLAENEFNNGFSDRYRAGFTRAIARGVETGRLDARMQDFDVKRLAAAIQPERDQLIKYMGAQVLYDRYFLQDLEQNFLEVPQYFWMRVAMGLSLFEESKEEKAIEFYEAMSTLHYVPSTPTLFNSGTVRAQMSSCYLTTVEDDLAHIFKSLGDNAQLSKYTGGIGNDWTNLRGTGARIKTTNVGSQGVIPFLKIADTVTAAINRSGKRRGATCAYLETWHYDIEDFLELRKNTGDDRRRTHDMNTANWIPDLFVKRVMADADWTLFSPDETPDLHHLYGKKFEERYEEYEKQAQSGKMKLFRTVKAKDLWRKMVEMLFSTGHPWMTFKDACNIRSPQDHVGVVHSSNLCTEITLNTSADETAVCNLGSINLVQHVKDKQVNYERLAETVKAAMRMLDNVIDLNYYPTVEAKNSNLRHRPVGLGVMGWQDMLYKMHLSFDSEAAVELADQLQEFIAYQAILASSELSAERGAYQTFKGSKWDRGIFPQDTVTLLEEERGVETGVPLSGKLDWKPVRESVKKHGMRNSNTMAIAPTATISNISGVFPSIEPIYKNIYAKSNFSGEFAVGNPYLVQDLKDRGLWNDDRLQRLKYYDGSVQQMTDLPAEVRATYKEVFEIEPRWLLTQAARRGKWIDQSQSLNLFLNTTSGKAISEVYANAWRMGLKTTYYLRTLGASAIEKSTLDVNKQFDQPKQEEKKPVDVISEPVLTGLKPKVFVASEMICEACE